MLTDKLKAWTAVPIDTVEKFTELFGASRASEIIKHVRNRTNNDVPTIEAIKGNLFVKDLTLKELQRLASLGGEEMLNLSQFLSAYQQARNNKVRPGRLSVDFKDGDETISGSWELAVAAMRIFMEEINARRLASDVHTVLQYSIPAFNSSRRIFGSEIISVGALPSDIIRKYGEAAFAGYARDMVIGEGAQWISLKIGELNIVQNLIDAEKPKTMMYVPPKESADIRLLLQTLIRNPTIEAIQIDAQ